MASAKGGCETGAGLRARAYRVVLSTSNGRGRIIAVCHIARAAGGDERAHVTGRQAAEASVPSDLPAPRPGPQGQSEPRHALVHYFAGFAGIPTTAH
jgi:hypothetical protein